MISDSKSSSFLVINRGIPQGTILGVILFSVMLTDLRPVHINRSLLAKFADDLTALVAVKESN